MHILLTNKRYGKISKIPFNHSKCLPSRVHKHTRILIAVMKKIINVLKML